jgi:hypothetical protein
MQAVPPAVPKPSMELSFTCLVFRSAVTPTPSVSKAADPMQAEAVAVVTLVPRGIVVRPPPREVAAPISALWKVPALGDMHETVIPAEDLVGAELSRSGCAVRVFWAPRKFKRPTCSSSSTAERVLAAGKTDATEFVDPSEWPERKRRFITLAILGRVAPSTETPEHLTTSIDPDCSAHRARLFRCAVIRIARQSAASLVSAPWMGGLASSLQVDQAISSTTLLSDESMVSDSVPLPPWLLAALESVRDRESWFTELCRRWDEMEACIEDPGVPESTSDGEVAPSRVSHLLRWAEEVFCPERRALIIVSNASGQGLGTKRWNNDWKPVFTAGGWTFTEHTTTHRQHATQILRELEQPLQYWCAVLIGGDGIPNEGIQGLFDRPDWPLARLLPILPLPAGSGNALAAMVCRRGRESMRGVGPAFLGLVGYGVPLDVTSVLVQQEPGRDGAIHPAPSVSEGSLTHILQTEGFDPLGMSSLRGLLTPAITAASTPATPDDVEVDTHAYRRIQSSKLLASHLAQLETAAGASIRPLRTMDTMDSLDTTSATPPGTLSAPNLPERLWWSCPTESRRFSILSLEWALPADIDVESESLRCCGANRFVAMALWRIVCLRRYRGRISFVRAKGPGVEELVKQATSQLKTGDPVIPTAPDWLEDQQAAISSGNVAALVGKHAVEAIMSHHPGDHHAPDATPVDPHSLPTLHGVPIPGPPLRYLRPFGEPLEDDLVLLPSTAGDKKGASPGASLEPRWETFSGEWTYLWGMQQAHQSYDVAAVPFATPADGILWLSLIRGKESVGRCGLACQLLDLDAKGSSTRHACVELIPCTAIRVEPEPVKWGGHVAVDGESVPYGPFQAEVHRGIARLMGL